ncbi:3-oxoacyl-ACP reductase family protein [Streptomyces sp. NPDC052396]|uniref:3-oxoacyl-ACP reductase family protein n=1 Tax=Streptomyces sp. NPDC052396 TaxID=3365689 RepID=UPI0037D65407
MSTTHSTDHRVALVTGGSRGIGEAAVLRLAAAGADVAFTYRSEEARAAEVAAKAEALGRRVRAIRADAADPAAVRASVAETVTAFGRLDILVNNAGVGVIGPIGEMTADDVDRVLAVNIRAVYLATQAAVAHLGPGGRVITIGSCMTERAAFPGGSLYAMSKAALTGLTKSLARELGSRGITVNLVQPGPIDTEMNPADGPSSATQAAFTAVGRYGHASEVADLIAYLAGPEAGYVTGAAVAVDGGFAA